MSTAPTAYAERITFWRQFAGFTQEQLAEKVGCSVTAVKLWESRARGHNKGSPPSWDNLRLIVDACGVSMAEFWGPLPRRRAA